MQESAVDVAVANIEDAKNQLAEILKPFQQEQSQRQRKFEFMRKCIQCIEKNDFFQLEELLKGKQAAEILEDANFEECAAIFSHLSAYADQQIANYRLQFKDDLLEMAEKAGLPIEIDWPRFSILKGIDGEIDFAKKHTAINQLSIKSVDPRRIVSAALNLKRKLYDSPFDAQKFINALLECYKEILKKANQSMGEAVPIWQLYTDYVWSLQSKTFFQNMDKGKFKGCSVEQFAVDLWRFFESDVSMAEGEYRLKLNPGRGKSLWLIDQNGEKRQITHASFIKI